MKWVLTKTAMDYEVRMLRQSNNVQTYVFGVGAAATLAEKIRQRREAGADPRVVFLIDSYFRTFDIEARFFVRSGDLVIWVDTVEEPSTIAIDSYVQRVRVDFSEQQNPCAILGIGGGIALDSAKALSNLLTNGGIAENYQGWDLLKVPGVYKIGVPTLSGTGAEASRTCVLTNKAKNIKLGMNSAFSVFDHLVLDPVFSETAERNQYFYTAMDTYIHCVESLQGSYRHALADAYSVQAIRLIREVCDSKDMMTLENREKVMVASYLGGASIANTYVGVVHPLSAGLSTVLHTHHCIANCLVMNVMDDFYPAHVEEFRGFLKKQQISLPSAICKNLSSGDFQNLYDSMIIHEKPLINALGPEFKNILSFEKVTGIFRLI